MHFVTEKLQQGISSVISVPLIAGDVHVNILIVVLRDLFNYHARYSMDIIAKKKANNGKSGAI